mmetsp:Transcript_15957/g.29639  ORF Transcript_15957/g.29639 Transcript_15957/m.29639 type:complete len:80 (-) Transcript_15957:1157-1396(-)
MALGETEEMVDFCDSVVPLQECEDPSRRNISLFNGGGSALFSTPGLTEQDEEHFVRLFSEDEGFEHLLPFLELGEMLLN